MKTPVRFRGTSYCSRECAQGERPKLAVVAEPEPPGTISAVRLAQYILDNYERNPWYRDDRRLREEEE